MFLLNRADPRSRTPERDHFTFHDVSIKSKICYQYPRILRSLHSTMFLLNHFDMSEEAEVEYSLHSTMFLLNLEAVDRTGAGVQSLHSTMFLLNRELQKARQRSFCLYIPRCFY